MLDTTTENQILLGDFNAHHTIWYDTCSDAVGKVIAEGLIEKECILHNENTRTFIARQGARDTSVDLTLSIKLKGITNLSWETLTPHASDHHPILSKWGISGNNERDEIENYDSNTLRYKFDKADWTNLEQEANNVEWEECINENINKYRDNIFKNITTLCNNSIPLKKKTVMSDKNKAHRTVPWWNNEIKAFKEKRDSLFREIREEFRIREKAILEEEYKKVRNKLGNLIKKSKNKYKIEKIESITESSTDSDLWNFVKEYDGVCKKEAGVAPLLNSEDNNITNNCSEKANILGKHYYKISSTNNYTNTFKERKKQHLEKNKHLLEQKPTDNEIYNIPFNIEELKTVINDKSESAPGEDNITYEFYKHLPERALNCLLEFFNQIWKTGKIPEKFKHAIIVPLIKPDKDPKLPASYRPISLTDHIGKIFESMVTVRLTYILESKGIISREQSGFRAKRQCMDQLARLTGEVQKCRKLNRQTAAVFIDLEKAYDQLWREGALEELHKYGIKGQMFNFVQDFLKGRSFQVKVDNTLSQTYIQENGTPQGSVLSPTIFNLVLNKIAKPLSERYKEISLGNFADDTALWVNHLYAPRRLYHNKRKLKSKLAKDKALAILEPIVNHLIRELVQCGFKVNANKTQCIVFDCDHTGKININGVQVPSTDTVEYLGLIIDKKLTFKKHIDKLKTKGEKALRILSYMCGKKWGLSARHRKLLYTNFILPKITYGEEIYNMAPDSYLKSLDYIQNQALRLISRNLKKTNIEVLHIINQIEPLRIRRAKKQVHLYTRFCQNPDNPASEIYTETRPLFSANLNRLGHKTDKFIDSTLKYNNICKIKKSSVATRPQPIPRWALKDIKIDINLKNHIDKKNTPRRLMKQVTENYIENTYWDGRKVYTDASKQNEKLGIGIFEEDTNKKQNFRLNDNLSITTGELVAVRKVLENEISKNTEHESPLVICTDSLGACKALVSGKYTNKARPDIIVDILNLNNNLKMKGLEIKIVWIPSHVDILGNEIADQQANEGRSKEEIDIDVKLGYSEIKQVVEQEISEKIYQNQYEKNQNYYIVKFRKIFPSIKTKINLDKDQYLMNRLRARACKINHYNEDIYCRICREKLDYKHVVKKCVRFEKERSVLERELLKENLKFNFTNILLPSLEKDTRKAVLKFIQKIDSVFPV